MEGEGMHGVKILGLVEHSQLSGSSWGCREKVVNNFTCHETYSVLYLKCNIYHVIGNI